MGFGGMYTILVAVKAGMKAISQNKIIFMSIVQIYLSATFLYYALEMCDYFIIIAVPERNTFAF